MRQRFKESFGKKNRRFTLLAVLFLVLCVLGGALVLRGQADAQTANDVSKVDNQRSQAIVTGTSYTMNKKQQKKLQQEEKVRDEKRKDSPTKKSEEAKKAAPSKENNKKSNQNTGKDPDKKKPTKEKEDPNKEKPSKEEPGDNKDPKAPTITTDLQNGKTISGKYLGFYVKAKNYKGAKIDRKFFTVTLNGSDLSSTGSQYKALYSRSITSEAPVLREGSNTVVISVKDREGNQNSQTLNIIMNGSDEAKPSGSATFVVTAKNLGLGTVVGKRTVKIYPNEKIAHAAKRYFEAAGVSISSKGSEDSGFYLERIHKNGITNGYHISDHIAELNAPDEVDEGSIKKDSLGEKDFFKGSGWMFSINGDTPNSGMASGTIEDGDDVEIWFTTNLGKDG